MDGRERNIDVVMDGVRKREEAVLVGRTRGGEYRWEGEDGCCAAVCSG